METTILTHSNVNEIATFVKEVKRFIDPSAVKTILELGSRDAEVSVALKKNFPYSKVFAFECNPPAIELCRRSISASGLEDITLIPKAVSDSQGTMNFYAIDPIRTVTPHADGNIGASSLFKANPDCPDEKYHQNKISVEATTLAHWSKQASVSAIDMIWMDLQGAELKALRGMGELLKNIQIIYTEIEFKPLYLGQPLFHDIDGFLRAQGFRLHRKFYRSEWFGDAMYVRSGMTCNFIKKTLGRLRG